MLFTIEDTKKLADAECKRYFQFDGVISGLLYLIHKYIPQYQNRDYEELYQEMLNGKSNGFVEKLNCELHSASNHLLKADKLFDVEMLGNNSCRQRALIELEIQNVFQKTYWIRACHYLCRVSSEYLKYMTQRYTQSYVPVISCWFMTYCEKESYPYVKYHPFSFVDHEGVYLMLAILSFQYMRKPPQIEDEIELAFYKLLSPHSTVKDRMEAGRVLHCEISEEEVLFMCNYSDACIAVGRMEGREIVIKELLKSMSVDEIVIKLNGLVTLEEVLLVAKEMSMNM